MGRSRGSSVVPGAAVKPKRARVSMKMPPAVAAGPVADARLPAFADLVGEPSGEVGAGLFELSLDVAFDGALGDAEQFGGGAGAFGLLDQVLHLFLRRLG
jgi:hypothetical protein